ncbi:anhydro-N-acetylmuramic acid kinase [Rubrivivax gelatinosus]|uniref:Anhydro-N-acetylmuramic acid kinase n=1 Tax=Rubrivivax gelatinosus TaxID=28068 RepID=A0ABS1DSE3_RUBGE|nr:anhydro-N-acetylmuramic acid kinase [Rubrivivax gelatinosus]MBK1613735.1 anhydro-N-acetylmuramic acid kinase [Rubrivivax gelatinosus]MBK1712279.1 anhydro-N-acetylmuramic acid kinase [Rubrivivax gelatinosus]
MLVVGLMSGTSLDGVDAVAVDFSASARAIGHVHHPYDAALRSELLALNSSGADELHRAALAANGVARAYAGTVAALLKTLGLDGAAVRAIGAHGQTVRHRPREFDGNGYTLQLLNGALLAELSGIAVVCDFRSRDLAAGGEGAPLVPAFHAQVFGQPGHDVAVLNLGGIANLTLLPADGGVTGFDCGPGNALLDFWSLRHLGQPYDADGAWAAGGQVDQHLLQALLADGFFGRPPPKSTGRDLFNEAWLSTRLDTRLAPRDVMATLAELTARGAADALQALAPATARLVVCGGGAFNRHLMARLAALLPRAGLVSSAEFGIPPDQVEAIAFAWLAQAHLERRAGNRVAVTGARGERVLGALYPA